MAAVASQNILRISRQQVAPIAGCYVTQRRTEFTVVKPGDHSNLAAYRRGAGGRSSFSGVVATVFGATGFVGKAIVNRLGRIGSQVICPYHGDSYYTRSLKVAGDLGQILFMPYDIRNEDDIRKAVKYSNVVINLVANGKGETRTFSFDLVNHVTAERIARISKEMGVERLIHFSDMAAKFDQKGMVLKGGSRYLDAKKKAEYAVMERFPDATIVRPSGVIGQADTFTWYYMTPGRRYGQTKLPLWKCGMETEKAPVYITDLATGVANALQDPKTKGQVIDAYGPKMYLLGDIVDFIIRDLRERYCTVSDMRFAPGIWMAAWANEKFSPRPAYTIDRLEADHQSDVIAGSMSLEDLGVQLTPVEPIIHSIVRTYRNFVYQEDPLMQDTMQAEPDVLRRMNTKPMVHFGI